MIRDEPSIDPGHISSCLADWYGIDAAALTFLPLGYDLNAAIYRVDARTGERYFLKVRHGEPRVTGLRVSSALTDLGTPNILSPLRTKSGQLWGPVGDDAGRSVVLFPFIDGQDAMTAGLTDDQWRAFGRTMRAIHESGLGERFRDQLRVERFDLPSAALIDTVTTAVNEWCFVSPAAERFAAFWRTHLDRTRQIVERAMELGQSLANTPFELVLCHADVHAANVLVGKDGALRVVDWDGAMIAPRERDLLFVVGSRIAREVLPREEALFFEGYGETVINPDALRYFRYERIIEDIGEIGRSVLLTPERSEEGREAEARLARGFFAPGGDIDRAEHVEHVRLPGPVT